MIDGAGDRDGGHLDQRRRTVRDGEPRDGVEGKVEPVDRFGRRAVEKRRGEIRRHDILGDAPASGELSVLVPGPPGVAFDPLVEERVAGAGVEGNGGRPVGDPGKVRHAAQVEHRDRPLHARQQRRVVERRERRSLPARRDIGAAKIVYRRDAERAGERPAVADLHGHAVIRAMIDGMTVKSHQFRGRVPGGKLRKEVAHGVGMAAGELRFDDLVAGWPAERRGEAGAEFGGIGIDRRRPEGPDRLAVGLDQRRVDAVERSPAHQPRDPGGALPAGHGRNPAVSSRERSRGSGRRSPIRWRATRPRGRRYIRARRRALRSGAACR